MSSEPGMRSSGRLCGPCSAFPPRHDDCRGGFEFCPCWTEVLIEADAVTAQQDGDSDEQT